MNLRDLMKRVDGVLVAVVKDGSQVPKHKVDLWSIRLRSECGLRTLPRRTVKVIKDNTGDLWAIPFVEGEHVQTWAEESTIEMKKEPVTVDPRLMDPDAPAMNHVKEFNVRKKKR